MVVHFERNSWYTLSEISNLDTEGKYIKEKHGIYDLDTEGKYIKEKQFPIDLEKNKYGDLKLSIVRKQIEILETHDINPDNVRNIFKLLANFKILSQDYGQFLSIIKERPIKSNSEPLPWFTYSCIEFLENLLLNDLSIFEWGVGNSTLYWSERAKEVFSVESNKGFYEEYNRLNTGNAKIFYENDINEYSRFIYKTDIDFDIIVIDGQFRYNCAIHAINKLKNGGFIILDNSDWYANTANYLVGKGFNKIDFIGFGPINNYCWSTSIFFKNQLEINHKKHLHVIGGINKIPDDDCELIHNLYTTKFYSQEGEDIILRDIFKNKINGFYVDVGAYHPEKFSITKYFYDIGWSGINIDPMPGTKQLFEKYRPNDINLEIAVSNSKGQLKYFIINEPALNTTDHARAKSIHENDSNNYQIINTIIIETVTLENILDQYSNKRTIDFLNIDVETTELDVLMSNNWEKFKPGIILVEILEFDLDKQKSDIHKFLIKLNYKLIARTIRTCIYKYND